MAYPWEHIQDSPEPTARADSRPVLTSQCIPNQRLSGQFTSQQAVDCLDGLETPVAMGPVLSTARDEANDSISRSSKGDSLAIYGTSYQNAKPS